MSATTALILGLLIGWLIEWVIDWIYWRRQQADLQSRLIRLREQMDTTGTGSAGLEKQLAALKADYAGLQAKLTGCESEKDGLSSRLAEIQASNVPPAGAVETVPAEGDALRTQMVGQIASTPDDLVVIKGIGPVIAAKLNQAGIYTFKELAAITPLRLREIVGDVIQRLADEDAILEEAKLLAAKKEAGG